MEISHDKGLFYEWMKERISMLLKLTCMNNIVLDKTVTGTISVYKDI